VLQQKLNELGCAFLQTEDVGRGLKQHLEEDRPALFSVEGLEPNVESHYAQHLELLQVRKHLGLSELVGLELILEFCLAVHSLQISTFCEKKSIFEQPFASKVLDGWGRGEQRATGYLREVEFGGAAADEEGREFGVVLTEGAAVEVAGEGAVTHWSEY
jgi:hypothetical protein